jgi:hypothetical protein
MYHSDEYFFKLKKQTMKKYKYIITLSVVAAGVLLDSCSKSFLERDPIGILTPALMATPDGVNGMLIATYASLDGQQGGNAAIGGGGPWEASPTNWIYGSVAAGDAHKGSDAVDQPPISLIATGNLDPSNGFFNTKWKAVFDGIVRANAVLSVLKITKGFSDAEAKNIEGQARFIRAHFYFELKKMFNKVPWIDENNTDPKLENTADIWPNIEADFKFAMENLPPTQSDVGRANKWAAAAYLAKTYLYQKKFGEAIPIYTDVITNGVTSNGLKYGLTDRFEDNFDPTAKNNKESVFAIQMTANNGTNSIAKSNAGEMLNFPYNSPFGCCGLYQPSQELVNSYRTDAAGLPVFDVYNLPANAVKSDLGVSSASAFTPDAGNLDPRLDWTVGRRGIPFLDWGNHPGANWARLQSYGGPYGPKKNVYWQYNQDKYKDGNTWAPGSAINIVLIRYSDVLLQAAEAEANNGSLSKAEDYVKQVRERAGKPETRVYTYVNPATPMAGFTNTPAANYKVAPYPTGTFATRGKDFALKAIYFERKLEFAMEGQRYFDLVRWGIAEQTINDFFAYESKLTSDLGGASFKKGRNEYYPIPQRQIDLSLKGGKPTLEQNQGYN